MRSVHIEDLLVDGPYGSKAGSLQLPFLVRAVCRFALREGFFGTSRV